MNKKYLIVVVGPTAVGKTDFTINLAQELNAPIVSADSRQFYKEMSIGTAKPSPEELKAAKHYFVDFLSIQDEYTVAQFEKEATNKLEDIYKDNDYAILTGGSGLFIDAVVNGLDEIPDISKEIRDSVLYDLEAKGLDFLLNELKISDPEYYNQVDKKNPRRVCRGIEVCRQTGKSFSEFRKGKKKIRPFHTLKIGLIRNREELYDRINQRVDKMIKQGLVDEVKGLYKYRNVKSMNTVGYSEVIGYLQNEYDLDQAVSLIKRNTRRYAKRQLTWFQKDKSIKWFDLESFKDIYNWLKGNLN